MKLLFEDRYGRYREVAEVANRQAAATAIQDFLKQFNYKSYYTRIWIRENEDSEVFYVMYDVGSHTEFFSIPFLSYAAAKKFLEE